MTAKFKVLLIYLLTLCCSASTVLSRGHYTAIAPGTIRSNSEYFVALSLDDFGGKSSWFNISIIAHCAPKPLTQIDQVEVQSNSTKLVKMIIPKLTHACGKLKIEGVRGIYDYHEAILYVETHDFTVYIQTDKAKYKPGEMVQFRVICIDRLTRPAQVKDAIDVLVFDGENNLIKKISNVKLMEGVFRGDLQLSEYPVLGDWRIEVNADGYTLQNKSFEVARYELATFVVEIDTRQDVSLDEGRIDVKVKSRYTYDQPVKGDLTVTLHNKYSLYGTRIVDVTKYSTINGESAISFNFSQDLNMNIHSTENTFILYTFDVTANVTNSLTGKTRSAIAEVNVYRQPYKVQLKAPADINPGEMFNITVSVKNLQGIPILDTENPVTIRLSSIPIIAEYQTLNMDYLNESGIVTVSMPFPKTHKPKIFRARAEYLDCASHWIRLNEKISNVFHLDVLTEKPEVGKLFVIEIWSKDPINYFVYEIVSRGDIIQTERIDVPGNVTKYRLSLNATYPMVPKIIFFMHRITNSVMDSQLKEIYIKRDFQNSIQIDAEPQVKPGENVSVNVTTEKGSYIGLMGIDERLLLDTVDHNDLNEDNVYTHIRSFDAINMNNAIYPGAEAGLITFSNALNRAGYGIGVDVGTRLGPEEEEPKAFDKPSPELPHIRKLFSESWIFQDFQRSPSEVLKLNETIPDTITSWALTGFSLNSNTGLALTKNVTKVRVFQQFFITFDLPSLVKAGELIEIPVYLFNYFDEDLVAKVSIDSSSKDIDLEPNQAISKSVTAKGSEKVVYHIGTAKPGLYTVTVKATSDLASDIVQKTLRVEAEGVPFSFSKTYLVHFLEESEQEDDIVVDIPEDAVLGSETLQLSVVGNVFGTLMNSLEKLVRHQHGSGADNVKFFVSNLLVLKYLAALNLSIPVIENKAKWHMELSYQAQFSFKHSDGSFAILDRSVGKTGDVWLTAYVMWALQQAKGFIHVKAEIIDKGLNYLTQKQGDNGGFNSTKGVEEDVALTGFTMLAFLLDEKGQNKYEDVIAKGLRFLYEALDKVKLTTSAAMSTYALVLGKHEKAEELLTKLRTHSRTLTGEPLIWTKPDNIESKLETTAYSFMCLLESQKKSIETLFPIVRSLVVTGGVGKTSAHTVALAAMIKFAKDLHLGRNDLKITYSGDQGNSSDFHITTDNAQVQQKIELNKNTRKVQLQSKGKGFALVELKYKYNLVMENQSTSIYETNVTFIESTDSKSVLAVCVAIRLQEGQNNVAVMKVNLLTGSSIDESSFEVIKWKNKQVKLIQMNEDDHSVLVLFESLTQNGMCIQFVVTNQFKVSNTKPMSVIVFDAFNNEEQYVSFFNATSSEE